jgi:hypothetical protein
VVGMMRVFATAFPGKTEGLRGRQARVAKEAALLGAAAEVGVTVFSHPCHRVETNLQR